MGPAPSRGEGAYKIKLTDQNKIGEGTYKEVYQV